MLNKSISHIFFDLDHTLWDFDKNSALTFNKILKIHEVDVDVQAFLEVYVPINLKYWKLYREEKIDKASLRYKRLQDAFNELNVMVQPSIIYKLSDDYIKYLTTFNHLFNGAIEVLEYLNEQYNLHIITNGFKEVQHSKLNQANINHYFDTVTNSEMVGVKKPNPKIFEHALEKARATTQESVMIGDNYEADILGALNVGMQAICFNYHNEQLSNDIPQITKLMQLKNYF